jgi:hypothetical protein
MKKVILLAVVLVCLVMVMVAADFRMPGQDTLRKNCSGYTIIEYDKGINCHGDTIQLVRKNGFAQPAR